MEARQFFIPGAPVGKDRSRFNRRTGAVYQTKKNAEYEEKVKTAYLDQWAGLGPITGPISADIILRFPIPKSDAKKTREAKQRMQIWPCNKKPDVDNAAKIILDALNGVAFHDDAQIIDLTTIKIYAGENQEVGAKVILKSLGE